MKKKLLTFTILICVVLTGCNNNETKTNLQTNNKKEEIINKETTNEIIEDSSILNEEEIVVNTENNNSNDNSATTNQANTSNNTTNYIPSTNNTQNNTNFNDNSVNKEENIKDNVNNDNDENPKIEEKPQKITIDAIKEYYCTEPFVLKDGKCTYLLSNDALIKYTCSEGILSGNKCNTTSTIENTLPASQMAKELCSAYSGGYYAICLCEKDGGTYNTTNKKCYKTINVTIDANIEYYCTSGTILNGTKCQKYYETDAPFNLSCPQGYTLNGIYCEK